MEKKRKELKKDKYKENIANKFNIDEDEVNEKIDNIEDYKVDILYNGLVGNDNISINEEGQVVEEFEDMDDEEERVIDIEDKIRELIEDMEEGEIHKMTNKEIEEKIRKHLEE